MAQEITRASLHTIDYIIMAAYMIGLIGMGVYYRRFAQEGLENYFLAGRKFKGWQTGTSYAVTCMNADVAPAYCGMTVITGLFICWWYISRFGLALMIGGILFAVFWRRLKLFTSPEFYELRFSGTPAITMRTWVSLRSAFIAVVAWTGSGLLGMAKVSEPLLGWEPWQTFAVVIPVILIYVMMSGYIGVVISDIVQTAILLVSSFILMGMVWADFGGPIGLYDQLVAQFGTGVVSWHPRAATKCWALWASSRGRWARPSDTAATWRRWPGRWKGSGYSRAAIRGKPARCTAGPRWCCS